MSSLFVTEPIHFNLPDADITYYPSFFDDELVTQLYKNLSETIPWQQDKIKVYGKEYAQPRLTALYGNDGKPYSYSNIKMQPYPWTVQLQKIKDHIENCTDTTYTTVLLNYYRDGSDSNGWHADNEKELGQNPTIASLSLGSERMFQLKHNTIPNMKQNLVLENGSLLLMKGVTQHFWKHQIPKTAKPIAGRINLTFRTIL